MATGVELGETGTRPRRRAPWRACSALFAPALADLALFAFVFAPASAYAGLPPVSVVQETRVTLDIQLSLLQVFGEGRSIDLKESRRGLAGERVTLSRTIDTPGGPLRVLLALTPDPDEPNAQCLVRVVSDARRGSTVARLDRTIVVRPGRSAILELWSAPDGANRLVLTLAARWADVPLVVAGVAGARTVELLVEPVIEYEGKQDPRPERRLTGIIGAPVRYSVHHQPAVAAPEKSRSETTDGEPAPDQEAEVLLDLLPAAVEGNDLDLSVRVMVETKQPVAADAPPAPPARRDTIVRRKVTSGETMELVVPLSSPGPTLVLRVTPFF